MQDTALDALAEAITEVANARNRIPHDRFLNEIALSVLILTRIASNRLKDFERRDEIESACDMLVDLIRETARSDANAAQLREPESGYRPRIPLLLARKRARNLRTQ